MSRDQQIRAEIELQCYGARPLWTSTYSIARQCRHFGLEFTELDIVREAEYLTQAGVLERETDSITGAARYRITAAGIQSHEQRMHA